MADDVKTNFVVEGKAKGLDDIIKQVLNINKNVSKSLSEQTKGYKDVQSEVKDYKKQLNELLKAQVTLNREMVKIGDKGAPAYEKLKDSLKQVNTQIRDTERFVKGLERSISGQPGKGAFLQGMMQTIAPGMAPLFLQRGPGMFRQMGGMAVGRAARGAIGFGTGLGGAMVSGLGGMQRALSSVPFVGGFAAGQLGVGAQFAQRSLQFERQRLEAAPFIREATPNQNRVRALRNQLRATTGGQANAAFQARTQAILTESVRQARREGGLRPLSGADMPTVKTGEVEIRPGWREPTFDFYGTDRLQKGTLNRVNELMRRRGELLAKRGGVGAEEIETPEALTMAFSAGRPGTSLAQRVRSAEQKAVARIDDRRSRLQREMQQIQRGDIANLGMRYRGISRQQALQEAAGIMQAAGGAVSGQRAFIGAAMAARTGFGVGPEVTGAFGMAARRGGLVGGRGRGAEGITEALAGGVRLGLEGSELVRYMQQVASGIQQFQTSGIPFSRGSIDSMGSVLARSGISGTRAIQVAQGFAQYTQGIGTRGPVSGRDVMLMQMMGGYTGKGGPEELEQTYINLEKLQKEVGAKGVFGAGGGMQDVMRRMIGMGGGGAMGRLFLRRQLGQMGVQVGGEEMRILGKQLTAPETLTEAERKQISGEQARLAAGKKRAGMIASPEELMRTVAGLVSTMGPNLRKQSEIQDKQLVIGESLSKTVLNLEGVAANASKLVSELVAGPAESLTNNMTKFSEKMGELVRDGGVLDAVTEKLLGWQTG